MSERGYSRVSAEIMGHQVEAWVNGEGYELTLFTSSGRRTKAGDIEHLIHFLRVVQGMIGTLTQTPIAQDEALPILSPEAQTVEEIMTEESAWTEPATETDLQAQSSDSLDLFWGDDEYDEDDEEGYYYPYQDDEEEDEREFRNGLNILPYPDEHKNDSDKDEPQIPF